MGSMRVQSFAAYVSVQVRGVFGDFDLEVVDYYFAEVELF
jgi:hypothetical protein